MMQKLSGGPLINQIMTINKFLMRTIRKIFLSTLLTSFILLAYGSPAKDDSLRIQILLTSKMLSDTQTEAIFINDLDITSDRLILLSTNNRFYVLGWGGIEAVGQKVADTINSFAYTPDGFLMTVRNKELCYMDSLGNISKLFGLPASAMGITAGKYVMYVYDRNKGKTKNALFIVARGGKYTRLFEIATPIISVAEFDNSLLFATENAVFRFNSKNKSLKVLVALPKDKEIKSLTVDSLNYRIYFSTDSAVYALKDSSAVIVSDEFGGVLRYYNNGLLVFNPEKKFLIRLSGVENVITSKMQPVKSSANEKQKTDILTNSSIVNLVKTKLSDNLIITLINGSEVNFNLSVDSMIFLSNQNVSSAVIMSMKNAVKRKTGISTTGNNPDNNTVTNNQPSQNISTSATTNTINNKFYIIAGSYPSEQQANDAVSELKRTGFPDAEVVGKNSYGSYRFSYKGYSTTVEASKDLIKIRQTINPNAWIFENK
jgi:hypothetical protein